MTIPGTAVILPGMTTTGFALPADLAYEEWCATGHALARVGRAIQWAIGDWLNFGEAAYGERYAQAISELGLDYQTVSNYAWVARTFPASSREEKLTFRHHLDAAGVANPAQRAELLLRAVTEGWSTRQVRMEANSIRFQPTSTTSRSSVNASSRSWMASSQTISPRMTPCGSDGSSPRGWTPKG
jgi:hypothetical protein